MTPEATEEVVRSAQTMKLIQLLKDNRIEMMIVTILLYSTGLLNKAVEQASGVCF